MAKASKTQTAALAPEAEAGSDSKTDTEVSKRAVAKHEYLDASGNVVEEEEAAHGIRYTNLETGAHVDYIPQSDAAKRMTWVFGCKTLATNEASQARQKGATGSEQLEAIKERFDYIETGKWVDRTGGVGAKVNLDTLAQAMFEVMTAAGKSPPAAADLKVKLEGNKALQTTARANPQISAKYAELMGRTIKSVDDVFSAIG